MFDSILMCIGLVLVTADHDLNAPNWVWLVNLTGLACVAVVAYRNHDMD